MEPTAEESRWIERLRKVCADMPQSCWLFAADSGICVMRRGQYGRHAIVGDAREGGGMDQKYILASVKVDADGGDW